MTAHARTFARLCRERLVAQGLSEEEAAAACAEETAPEVEVEQLQAS